MRILALELSSVRGSIAVLSDDVDSAALAASAKKALAVDWANDRKNSGEFFKNLENITKEFGPPDKIIVGLGPGSYAGTRIAIGAAIGLQTATGARLIGCPSICAME